MRTISHGAYSLAHLHVAMIATILFLAAGCSVEEGPPRYRVSGTVTYQGEPVPTGVIQFTPDASKGSSGPPGFAEIEAGVFDTKLSGKGVVGGPHRVTVDAFSGENVDPDLLPSGSILVSNFQQSLDLNVDSETVVDLELTKK